MEQEKQSKVASGKGQRQLKNLLIDKQYQLRYTALSVVISVGLCACLGAWVIWQSRQSTRFLAKQRDTSTQLFRKQRALTTKVVDHIRQESRRDLKKVLKTSRDMLDVQLKDKDPGVRAFAQLAKQEFAKSDAARLERQKKADSRLIKQRTKEDQLLLQQRQAQDQLALSQRNRQEGWLIAFLLGFSFIVVCVISMFSILLTHKVAGPLFKMGRYFDEIREGRLSGTVNLRRGDQLQGFYHRFQNMHEALKERANKEREQLQEILEQDEGLSKETRETLQALLEQRLQATESKEG